LGNRIYSSGAGRVSGWEVTKRRCGVRGVLAKLDPTGFLWKADQEDQTCPGEGEDEEPTRHGGQGFWQVLAEIGFSRI
jgi:hypothetical protein